MENDCSGVIKDFRHKDKDLYVRDKDQDFQELFLKGLNSRNIWCVLPSS